MTFDVGRRCFLVELHAPDPHGAEVEGMSRALRAASGRLHGAGSAVEWLVAVKRRGAGDALCFLAAGDEADVVLACDVAGLPQAPVQEVVALFPGAPSRQLRAAPLPRR